MKWLCSSLISGLLLVLNACGNAETSAASPREAPEIMNRKLEIQIGSRTVTAVLYESAAAKELLAQLPLTLTLTDYNATEKIADLPKRLSSSGAPDGFTPSAGDIAYYAPWGNLAIFYRPFRYSKHLIHLGKIENGGIHELSGPGDRKVTIRALSVKEETP